MKYAALHEHGDLRFDLSDVERDLESIAAFDPSARDLPPQGFGNQIWRTAAEYHGLVVVPGRCLHPDRLTQLFDNDNSLFDTYRLECKPKRKGKGFAPSSRGDTSARDFKLAVGAAKQKFELQEMADLLIGCRAQNNNDFKRRDYYLRTIWRAKEDAAREGEAGAPDAEWPPPPEGEEEKPAAAPQGDDEILASLPPKLRKMIPQGIISDADLALRLRATRRVSNMLRARSCQSIPHVPVVLVFVLKISGDAVTHSFYFSDGGSVSELEWKAMSDRKAFVWGFQNAGYHITPPLAAQAAGEWLEELRIILTDATVTVPADPLATKAGELRELIDEYCHTAKRLVFERADLKDWPNAVLVEKEAGNKIWISSAAFQQWLKRVYNKAFSGPDFAKLADRIGLKRERFRGKLNRMMFAVPELDVIALVEAFNSRNVNPNSIAREEEDSRVQ